MCRQKDCGTDGAGGEGAVVCWLVEKFEVRKWIQVAWGCCRVGWARVCDAPERTGKNGGYYIRNVSQSDPKKEYPLHYSDSKKKFFVLKTVSSKSGKTKEEIYLTPA